MRINPKQKYMLEQLQSAKKKGGINSQTTRLLQSIKRGG